jgi:hypothetical protein
MKPPQSAERYIYRTDHRKIAGMLNDSIAGRPWQPSQLPSLVFRLRNARRLGVATVVGRQTSTSCGNCNTIATISEV